MSTQVMVTLPDEVYNKAERLAELTRRNVDAVLAETIEISFQSLGGGAKPSQPISDLSNQEVLALADSRMPLTQNRRLSGLLDKQQAGTLTVEERAELWALMQVYQEGLLRKAQAMREAVQRGLRKASDF